MGDRDVIAAEVAHRVRSYKNPAVAGGASAAMLSEHAPAGAPTGERGQCSEGEGGAPKALHPAGMSFASEWKPRAAAMTRLGLAAREESVGAPPVGDRDVMAAGVAHRVRSYKILLSRSGFSRTQASRLPALPLGREVSVRREEGARRRRYIPQGCLCIRVETAGSAMCSARGIRRSPPCGRPGRHGCGGRAQGALLQNPARGITDSAVHWNRKQRDFLDPAIQKFQGRSSGRGTFCGSPARIWRSFWFIFRLEFAS